MAGVAWSITCRTAKNGTSALGGKQTLPLGAQTSIANYCSETLKVVKEKGVTRSQRQRTGEYRFCLVRSASLLVL